jgi:TetR/AcrR family transcriptional repressor of nem operon
MPYPPDHKPRTRVRIVSTAARLFRERGYSRTSVDDLMAEAGLTRGGFYAHFESKTMLLVAAIEHAFQESRANLLEGRLASLRGPQWRMAAAERYLADAHRAQPGQGCAVPALGAEVARGEPTVRDAFERELARLVAGMAERLGGDRAQALRALSTWVGAITLARAVRDPELARAILDAAREPG